jgi:secreted PhoX family phosphatase
MGLLIIPLRVDILLANQRTAAGESNHRFQKDGNYLLGITSQKRIYKFAWNALNESDLSGVCFSPDGSTMFLNILEPGLTLAITGPWKK